MQIDLGTVSAEQLTLDLAPARVGARARTLRVASAEQLVGALRTHEQGWAATGLGCARLLLQALSWSFGRLELQSEPRAELAGLAGEIASSSQVLELRLSSKELQAPRLWLTIGALKLSAQVAARALILEVDERVAVLRAQNAVFSQLELQSGELRMAAPELVVSELTIDWGGDAFRLEAGTAEARTLHVQQGGARLRAEGISVAALRTHGSELSIGQTRLGRLELERPAAAAAAVERAADPARTAHQEHAAPKESDAKPMPKIDARLFDGLEGRLSADVVVDVAVPIVGHRRATHELRVGVQAGTIDYRELEHGLATLEDALFDFSVREGALVLERGLPLISTRGRGKPILIWDLGPSDLELVQRGRVRLAVLPSFRLASRSAGEPSGEEGGGSAFRLLELALRDVDFSLALLRTAVVADGLLRQLAFDALTIQGDLCHRNDEPDCAGALRVAARTLRIELNGLPLGPRTLSGRLELAALERADVAFAGFAPRGGRAVLEAVAIADLALR